MIISESMYFPILAQTSPGQGDFAPFLPMILLFLGMYFLIIAPQRKRRKAHDQMLQQLQTGDKVISTGGIYGTITNVRDDRFVVRIADNTKIEIGKAFIADKVREKAN